VAVVEKSPFPRRKVCGEFVSASNALLLAELGIAESYAELAGPDIRRIGAFARDAAVAADVPHGTIGAGGWGRALGREKLDAILLDQAVRNGAHLWQPWSAVALEYGRRVRSCRIAAKGEERTLRAPIIIAAHGSWERSSLPTQAARPHKPSDLLAFKAHFRSCGLPADLMPLLAFPGGYGGIVTSDCGRVSLSCCIRRDALQECRKRYPAAPAAEAVLRHISASCIGLGDALSNAELEDRWLAAGPINPGMRGGMTGGVFLVGNAAGEAHPIVAEGISMAMQSASLLCRELFARQDEPRTGSWLRDVGRAYSARWRSHFSTRIRAAALFAHVAMRPAQVRTLVPIVKTFPAMLIFGARLSGKRKLHTEMPAAPVARPANRLGEVDAGGARRVSFAAVDDCHDKALPP